MSRDQIPEFQRSMKGQESLKLFKNLYLMSFLNNLKRFMKLLISKLMIIKNKRTGNQRDLPIIQPYYHNNNGKMLK